MSPSSSLATVILRPAHKLSGAPFSGGPRQVPLIEGAISYDCAQQGTRSTSARPHQPTSRTRLYRTTFPWFPRPAPQHVISSPFNVLPTLPQVYAAPIPPQPIILYLYAAIHRTSNVAHMTSSKSSPPQCSQRGERRLYPMTVWSTATKVRPILGTPRHDVFPAGGNKPSKGESVLLMSIQI